MEELLFTGFDHRSAKVQVVIYKKGNLKPCIAEMELFEARKHFADGLEMCNRLTDFINKTAQPQQEEK